MIAWLKDAVTSKTIWGLVALLVGLAIQRFKLDQAGLTTDMVIGWLRQILEIGGSIMVIYGRARAQRPFGK